MSVAGLLDAARQVGLRIATAESCTGGLVSAALTEVPGSSDVVECGFVTYSNGSKIRTLGVSPETLEAHGAVSEEVAGQMATGALEHCEADIAVSVTGIAGPGGSDVKPEGRVCFGLARRGHPTTTETHDFGAPGRAEVRRLSRDHALALLARAVAQP